MKTVINAIDFGCKGNGIENDAPFLQKALYAAVGNELFIPDGDYRISDTLKLPSNTTLRLSENAHLFHCEKKPKVRGEFLLSNEDIINGNENISVCGVNID